MHIFINLFDSHFYSFLGLIIFIFIFREYRKLILISLCILALVIVFIDIILREYFPTSHLITSTHEMVIIIYIFIGMYMILSFLRIAIYLFNNCYSVYTKQTKYEDLADKEKLKKLRELKKTYGDELSDEEIYQMLSNEKN